MALEETIRKHALKNAFDYGKAEPGGVVGKVVAEFPDAKKDMKKTMQLVVRIIAEVNKMGRAQVEAELSKFEFVKKEEGPRRWELPGAEEGKVVTRFLPEPNGYPHIGHAKAAWLSYEFARQWKGKCHLRFDDTNPEKEKQEYVDAIRRDVEWLGLSFPGETYSSDMIPEFYKYAEKLIKQGDAYVCGCKREEMSRNRMAGKECTCRGRPGEESLRLWKGMLKGEFEEEQYILRLRGDMKSLNTVMRDPTLFRINVTPHYRKGTKYAVWPTYDFEVSIADSLDGVTHAMRSKEYELRDELYYEIPKRCGFKPPQIYDFSRLNLKGTMLSKRFLKPLIDEGKVMGWDDPRLPTLIGLKRRGIPPEAIKSFVLQFGLSKVESEPGWDALLVEAKRLVEPSAEHYYFVPEPVKVSVKNATGETARLKKLHTPNSPVREIKTTSTFYIPKTDADAVTVGEIIRLKDLCNIKITKKAKGGLEAEFAGNESVEAKKVQWVSEPHIEVSVAVLGDLFIEGNFNPGSMKWEKGLAEPAVGEIQQGAVVQFERYGFCKLDDKKGGKFILAFR